MAFLCISICVCIVCSLGDRVYVDGREDLGLLSSIEVPLDDWSEVLDSLNRSDVEVLDSPNSHMRRVLDS